MALKGRKALLDYKANLDHGEQKESRVNRAFKVHQESQDLRARTGLMVRQVLKANQEKPDLQDRKGLRDLREKRELRERRDFLVRRANLEPTVDQEVPRNCSVQKISGLCQPASKLLILAAIVSSR